MPRPRMSSEESIYSVVHPGDPSRVWARPLGTRGGAGGFTGCWRWSAVAIAVVAIFLPRRRVMAW